LKPRIKTDNYNNNDNVTVTGERSALALLVARLLADHPHDTIALDDLAVPAQFLH
jgi:hypothetical protein